MKPSQNSAATPTGAPVCCDVAAYATIRATPEELVALRGKPGPGLGVPLPSSFPKHADDQTVAGLAAVFQAIPRLGASITSFRDWGALAAPRFLGRVTLTHALQRFAVEGAWGISPHLIPHRSLHAISGTVSQALKIHGPNFGVGGGPGAAAEALLAASALIAGGRLPGVWVVLTGWDPEPMPNRDGRPSGVSMCLAIALALVSADCGLRRPRIRIVAGPNQHDAAPAAGKSGLSLEALLMLLVSEKAAPATAVWQLECGGRLEVDLPGIHASAEGLPGPHFGRGAGRDWSRLGAGTENHL